MQVEGKIPVLEALKESIQDRMVGLEIRSLSILHTFAEHQVAYTLNPEKILNPKR